MLSGSARKEGIVNKRHVALLLALIGIALTVYLVVAHDVLATIGSYVWRWVLLLWEPLVRSLEIIWRPMLVLAENVIRGLATRPFGRALSWFFLGFVLRYVLDARTRALYERVTQYVAAKGRRVGEFWYTLPLLLRIVLILCSAVAIGIVNIGLLLLPLGFFIEPAYRWIRNWLARESVANVSFVRRMALEAYRITRVLMRRYAWFRKLLGPFRAVRLRMIRSARRLHYHYRRQGKSATDMLRDIRKERKKKKDQ